MSNELFKFNPSQFSNEEIPQLLPVWQPSFPQSGAKLCAYFKWRSYRHFGGSAANVVVVGRNGWHNRKSPCSWLCSFLPSGCQSRPTARTLFSPLSLQDDDRLTIRRGRTGLTIIRGAAGAFLSRTSRSLPSAQYDPISQVLRLQYERELAQGHVTTQTKFNYAWGLIKSTPRTEQAEGIKLMQGEAPASYCLAHWLTTSRNADLYRAEPQRRRECLYYLALGHYKLANYEEARKYNRERSTRSQCLCRD